MASIPQEVLDRVAQYNIGVHVEQYRGKVPWPDAMAMGEHESEHDPLLYNYYPVENGVKNTKKLEQSRATPGAPPCARWTKPGDGGCAHDPHACGDMQILDSIRLHDGGYGGVKLPLLNDLFDAEKNIQAALAGRSRDYERIMAAGVTDPVLLRLCGYLAHTEGLGVLIGGEHEGALTRLKREGKALTWVNLCALPWGTPGFWTIHNRLSGVAKAMERAPLWAAAQAAIMQGAGADELPHAEPDTRPRCDALIAEVQAAEMARDLELAAQFREELVALVGPEGGLA